MNEDIQAYNDDQQEDRQQICELLANEIQKGLPEAESKIWHGSPVWFLQDNPIVGYESAKDAVRLLFWSGQSFEEAGLSPVGKHKAAGADYTSVGQINTDDLQRWLEKSKNIQWDYKNIAKNKGELVRLETE